ncbi:MAG: heterodisulfide reductase-related iron-sulfur binding cluster, partial [Alphaproteobacteria bacterium]
MDDSAPRVGLLVTCLVDLFRPSVGFAAARLLEDAGCRVEVPRQTCCGQPAHNAGDAATARALARRMIVLFEDFDYAVAPSGSCAGMVKIHYPEMFAADAKWAPRARALAAKTFELTQFLAEIAPRPVPVAKHAGRATYHDACAGLRE